MVEPLIVAGMPVEQYHAEFALSASGAWLLAQECPALYWHRECPWNPQRSEKANRRAMDIGTALHLAVLEHEEFEARTQAIVDYEDYKTKAAREMRDRAYADGRTPLLWPDIMLVDRLRKALLADPWAADLIDDAQTEVSLFWDDEGVPCKARPDLITRDGAVLADLKTSTSAHPRQFERQAVTMGHYLRAAWYSRGYEIVTGTAPDYWFVVVAKTEPHLVTVCRLDKSALEWGGRLAAKARLLFKQCMESGEWPGYCREPATLGLPTWATFQLADREAAGEFPEPQQPGWLENL